MDHEEVVDSEMGPGLDQPFDEGFSRYEDDASRVYEQEDYHHATRNGGERSDQGGGADEIRLLHVPRGAYPQVGDVKADKPDGQDHVNLVHGEYQQRRQGRDCEDWNLEAQLSAHVECPPAFEPVDEYHDGPAETYQQPIRAGHVGRDT